MGEESEDVETAAAGFEFDEGNLCVLDASEGDDVRPAAEALVLQIFGLPRAVDSELGNRAVVLPPATIRLPREKPVPRAPEPTKWEQFAKAKGIQKKKRDRMVWDEEMQKFMPRYGYKSKKSLHDVPILPDSAKLAPGEDPFAKAKTVRKEEVTKNKKKQAANELRNRDRHKTTPLSAVEAERGPSGKKKLPRRQLERTSKVAQVSTASVGKFDRQVEGEKAPKSHGTRRKFEAATSAKGVSAENKAMLKVADRLFLPKQQPAASESKTSAKKPKKNKAAGKAKGTKKGT